MLQLSWVEKLATDRPDGNLVESLAHGDLRLLASLYNNGENPAAAWLCWQLAQKWQLPVPDAVLDEISRFTLEVARLAASALDGNARAKTDREAIAKLWSPKTTPGRPKTLHNWSRNLQVALRVFDLRDTEGKPKNEAVALVATKMGMSPANVEQIYDEQRESLLAAEAEARQEEIFQIEESEKKEAISRSLET